MQHDGNSAPQAATAPKYRNWRHRKAALAARGEAMASRQQLVESYIAALGGNVGPIVMADVERAADLVMLARDMRDAVRQGKVRLAELTSLEGLALRAVKALGLKAPNTAAPVMDLHDIVSEARGRARPSGGE